MPHHKSGSNSRCSRPPGFFVKGKYNSDGPLMNISASPCITVSSLEAWKKFFAPSDDDPQHVIKVSLDWVNFICSILLTLDKFEWAKSFLQSSSFRMEITTRIFLNFSFLFHALLINHLPVLRELLRVAGALSPLLSRRENLQLLWSIKSRARERKDPL